LSVKAQLGLEKGSNDVRLSLDSFHSKAALRGVLIVVGDKAARTVQRRPGGGHCHCNSKTSRIKSWQMLSLFRRKPFSDCLRCMEISFRS
jgi:hypothetical protein